MKRIVAGLILIFLCSCSAKPLSISSQTPVKQNSPTSINVVSFTSTPFLADTSTITPSPVPAALFQSPLQGISIDQLAGMITNPFDPPPTGSDDPHAGIDLSDLMPETQMAISGRQILAITGGHVSAVTKDRFPYGNALIVETSLANLPVDLIDALDLPDAVDTTTQPISLTCTNGIPFYSNHDGRSLYVLYAHMEQPPVLNLDDEVTSGQVLGTIGMSGNALNPHLHLEVRIGPSNVQFGSMAHYDETATIEEMTAYCTWKVGGQFQVIDPMVLFTLNP